MKIRNLVAVCMVLVLGGITAPPRAAVADEPVRMLVIKDHVFSPSEIELPADVRVKLIVDNQDATPEEFESHDLHIEKIIPGNSKGTVWIGPLPKGTYSFVGEFHEATAKGTIIVK